MSYFIRWQFAKGSPQVHASRPFPTREAAVASACTLLAFDPYVIWVEDSSGIRIGADEIARDCHKRSEGALPGNRGGSAAA